MSDYILLYRSPYFRVYGFETTIQPNTTDHNALVRVRTQYIYTHKRQRSKFRERCIVLNLKSREPRSARRAWISWVARHSLCARGLVLRLAALPEPGLRPVMLQ